MDPSHDIMEKSIVADLKYELAKMNPDFCEISSIYFGGGTPSLARPNYISSVVDCLSNSWTISKDVEITLEGNPKQLKKEKMMEFNYAGINRISLGVQALDNDALKFFGRDHDLNDALCSIDDSLNVFNNVSLDFIWGRPNQTISSWTSELKTILHLGASHLSLYQLTVERGTKLFHDARRNNVALPNEDTAATMYQSTRELCIDYGYSHYEISSFAKTTGVQSQHNLAYWDGTDYIGVGPGSHGRVSIDGKIFRTYRILYPKEWMDQVAREGNGIRKALQVDILELKNEWIVFGLRKTDGVFLKHFQQKFPGEYFESVFLT
jgi:putative oxygen-independent coproporphyrinogen III oxidase